MFQEFQPECWKLRSEEAITSICTYTKEFHPNEEIKKIMEVRRNYKRSTPADEGALSQWLTALQDLLWLLLECQCLLQLPV